MLVRDSCSDSALVQQTNRVKAYRENLELQIDVQFRQRPRIFPANRPSAFSSNSGPVQIGNSAFSADFVTTTLGSEGHAHFGTIEILLRSISRQERQLWRFRNVPARAELKNCRGSIGHTIRPMTPLFGPVRH
jgi:hypothetical protein